ncbi:unnamed protein product, partial [Brugia pahangi]
MNEICLRNGLLGLFSITVKDEVLSKYFSLFVNFGEIELVFLVAFNNLLKSGTIVQRKRSSDLISCTTLGCLDIFHKRVKNAIDLHVIAAIAYVINNSVILKWKEVLFQKRSCTAIVGAHDTAIRALKWSHNDQWLVSADHDGFVKYWQPNMNNVHMYQAHKDEAIRSISFAPTDVKLVTGSDDATARIWDFARCAEEKVLRGHGSDVRSVDWHPQK